MRRARRMGAAIGAAATWLWAAVALAQAAPPMRAIVRLAASADVERMARIEGQTVDLAVTLVPVETAPVEGELAAQLATARALATEHDARAVIWFRDDGEQVSVAIADPTEDTLFVRRVAARPGAPALAASASAEASALIVRSALRALAAGGRIGVRAPPAPAPPPPAPAAAPIPAAAPEAIWFAGLAAVAAVDGASPVQAGAAAWLGRTLGRWRGELAVSASPPRRLDDAFTAVSLSRYTAGVAVGLALWPGWSAELAAGAIRYDREASALDPSVMAAPPARLWAGYLGPGVRWRLGDRVGLELAVGVDAVAGAPELGYRVAGSFERRDRLWVVQPRVSVGVAVRGF